MKKILNMTAASILFVYAATLIIILLGGREPTLDSSLYDEHVFAFLSSFSGLVTAVIGYFISSHVRIRGKPAAVIIAFVALCVIIVASYLAIMPVLIGGNLVRYTGLLKKAAIALSGGLGAALGSLFRVEVDASTEK